MLSEYYDHYHRWIPLAEFHFNVEDENYEEDEDNYLYCLCSRVFIRDAVKTYYANVEYGSESEVEVLHDSQSHEWDDNSHVHFSLDTSDKIKCEKDEGASCYCSASHTDNCSNDEHDLAQIQSTSHALQPSDSGADLSYHNTSDNNSDFITHEKSEKTDRVVQCYVGEENYLSEDTWEKFWGVHGERLIWASWVKTYSDYINPRYLNDDNDLLMDENGIPKKRYDTEIVNDKNDVENHRERKFSYDSKVNPCKKTNTVTNFKNNESNKDDQWLIVTRRRSCSEHERIISPKTTGTDSMTNVTKLTLSSYDMTSSHVTSESTDDYSVSSSSDDQSNDQTRIANVDEKLDSAPTEEMENQQYWQYLWKEHFEEQYALHYAKYIEQHNFQTSESPIINVENDTELTPKTHEKVLEIECENSEGNSLEMATVIEVQKQVQNIVLEDKDSKPRISNKKSSNRYLHSVGALLQNLIKEEQNKISSNEGATEVLEAGENKDNNQTVTLEVAQNTQITNLQNSVSNNNLNSYNYDEGDDDPPVETSVTLKRRDGSESGEQVLHDSQSHGQDDNSDVHLSLDTSDKIKCEKDEGANCYCGASHTDNCSDDEHDPSQIQSATHALQPSDSGADFTYHNTSDNNFNFITHEQSEQDEQFFAGDENYLAEDTWEKFWGVHGERLIWASWIKTFSDYIKPEYLNDDNDLLIDENGMPKKHHDTKIVNDKNEVENQRQRKFSYDSKVNPCKKTNTVTNFKSNKDDQWLIVTRRRSYSEHERIISPGTLTGTDSMTNVTKLTLSSYDMASSHVTSESTPTDNCSVSSSSDDQSNDQTRIANVDENLDSVPTEGTENQDYWRCLWKEHFEEQYALHYAKYIEQHNFQTSESPIINVENDTELTPKTHEKVLEIECENSEGNSLEIPTVIEVQEQVQNIVLEDTDSKPKISNKKSSNRYLHSVGALLQNLIKEEQKKINSNEGATEVLEAGDSENKDNNQTVTLEIAQNPQITNLQNSVSNNNLNSYSYDEGDDDPPEETSVTLKRSHEIDEEDVPKEKIRSTFETMGFCLNSTNMPKGYLVYRKRLGKLRPPRNRRYGTGKKTYFEDEDNSYDLAQTKSQEEIEMQADNEWQNVEVMETTKPLKTETEEVDIQEKFEALDGGNENLDDENVSQTDDVVSQCDVEVINETEKSDSFEDNQDIQQESSKNKKRQKRFSKLEAEDYGTFGMPDDLRKDRKMMKYWKKRHSLFHRFDEGIKLDRESWFSVTPENVARHIATKCPYDVVLDAFCGAGGNTIQFARICKKVIAVDIDPAKIEMAKHNAEIYGVADRIEFIVGDFFDLAPQLSAEFVFLSPPWGGPEYSNNREYDLETMLQPRPASELMNVARTISPAIALFLPRNSRPDQILSLGKDVSDAVEIEQSYLDRRFVAITAYFY